MTSIVITMRTSNFVTHCLFSLNILCAWCQHSFISERNWVQTSG